MNRGQGDMTYEYKVVPAPTRGKKARGLKSPAERFAGALAQVMNELAAEGWEYLRTDTLPAEERSGLTGRTTVFQNMLVFRREAGAAAQTAPAIEALSEEIAEANAPKLPSAEKAQELPETPAKPVLTEAPKEVAAE
jgi:hypothetical protein